MLYSHLRIWEYNGEIWHSFYHPGTRDMSMGISKPWEIKRTIEWAKTHNMTIVDERGERNNNEG